VPAVTTRPVPFAKVEGDAPGLGVRHGAAFGPRLRGFAGDGLCRLDHLLPAPAPLEHLRPLLAEYRAEIAAQIPDIAATVEGLARGADLDPDVALLMQVRREILGYTKIPAAGDCTTYARAGEVLAQTIDLNGNLDDQVEVVYSARAGSDRRVLMLGFAGLLGYVGLNSDGLAVGLNLVLGGDWRPGVPPYLAVRHVLDRAATVAEAIEVLRGLRLASSRTFTLCDRDGAAYVEALGGALHVFEAPETVHTNHFLSEDFAEHDELNVFARNSSLRRLSTCQERLAAVPSGSAPREHFALLAEPPVYVAGSGNIRQDRTVATVVMVPDRGALHVRPTWSASPEDYQTFEL